jgi:hypothetical protein
MLLWPFKMLHEMTEAIAPLWIRSTFYIWEFAFLIFAFFLKVELSLCFNWSPRHEGVLGEGMYSSTHSLTSALDRGEWSASRPHRFTRRERTPSTHWIGGWVGPKTVLDAVVKRKILSLHQKSNPRTPIVQPVAQRYTDWAITALLKEITCIFSH